MKTTPPIDLQASCFNMDTYIFNEELLQCSAVTGLLAYGSILGPCKFTDWMAFVMIFVCFCMSDWAKLRLDSSYKDIQIQGQV